MKQALIEKTSDNNDFSEDLAQVIRLALEERPEDVRLYVARLVRRYRTFRPKLADQLEEFLRARPARTGSPLRFAGGGAVEPVIPVDNESRLSLLKVFKSDPLEQPPLLSQSVQDTLDQLIRERQQAKRLAALGLKPARSAIFVGKPGVGKTLSARWLASQLGMPLYVLDLTTVMSSLLGKTGSNLRAALDFAKQSRAVLLLDEIDAVAKRRSDDADIGELKRLVTVMLQEVDEWPADGLLLAATNHPELIDPALWRRFDLLVEFGLPTDAAVRSAIERFLDQDKQKFDRWIDLFVYLFKGESFSEVERSIHRLRRTLALGSAGLQETVEDFISARAMTSLDHQSRIDLAVLLARKTKLSHHTISEITGVSRDTIRKYAGSKAKGKKGDGE